MTTDYTSGMINQNIKAAAVNNRTFQTVPNTLETGGFDSVFENVSKNYTDNSEMKNSKQLNSKYAETTKNVNSAKKSSAQKNNNTKKQTVNNQTENTSAYNKQTENNIQKQQSTQNIKNKSVVNNQNTQKAETTNFEQSNSELSNDIQTDSFAKSVSEQAKDVVNTEKTTVADNNVNIPAESENEVLFAESQDFISAEKETMVINETVSDEQEHVEFVQEITNEQIQALAFNVLNDSAVNTTAVESFISASDEDVDFTDVNNETITETQAVSKSDTNSAEAVSSNTVLEQISKEITQNFQQTMTKDAVSFNADFQNTEKTDTSVTTTAQPLKIEENFVQGLDKSVIENSEKLSVEVSSDKFQITETDARIQKTAQENHTAETIRLNLTNDEVNAPAQDTVVLTPVETKSQEVDIKDTPLIQVTDEVAQNLKNFSEKTQNRDYAGKVKDKVTEKLAKLQGTDTVVTDVQNSRMSLQSGFESNSQSNTSLAQGNASEQAIKMSVENVADRETSSDSFISQLEAKLNAGAKTASVKQSAMLNKSDIMSQINAKFNELNQAGQSKVSIILRPENLGRVSVEIMNTKEGIVAKMTTDNQQVRDLLDKNIEALRANLSSQGVNVNNIKVECTNQSENNAMDFDRQQFEQNSQDFHGEQGSNRHAGNSNQSNETAFWDNLPSPEEVEEQASTAEKSNNTETTKTIITDNGKISYKV